MARNDIVKVDGSIDYDYLGKSIDGLSSQMADIMNVKGLGYLAYGNANYFNSTDRKYYVDQEFTILAHDDTQSVQKIIDAAHNKGGGVVYFPAGNYMLTNTIHLYSNVSLKGYHKNMSKLLFSNFNNTCISLDKGTVSTPTEHVGISSLMIDFTAQSCKGGTEEEPFLTNPDPSWNTHGIGIGGTYIGYLNVHDCIFNDIWGDGIRLLATAYCKIYNNILLDCSGGDIVQNNTSTFDGYDYFGDGMIFYRSFATAVKDNIIINKRTYLTHLDPSTTTTLSKDPFGLPCGRSGLEFEYPMDVDDNLHPYIADFNNHDGFDNTFENNYVYGYTKGCHLESTVKCKILFNTFIHCHIGLNYSTGILGTVGAHNSKDNDNCIIIGNYFDDDNIGKAPQAGYGTYYSGIALTAYSSGKNVIIQQNWFYGSTAILIDKNNISIENNYFYTNVGIGSVSETARTNIFIKGNKFNDAVPLSLRFNKDVQIISNTFFSKDTSSKSRLESVNSCIIKNNIFDNSSLWFVGGIPNISITNNIFKNNTTDTYIFFDWQPNYFTISSNKIYLGTSTHPAIIIVDGCSHGTIESNYFDCNGTDTASEMQNLIVLQAACSELKLNKNIVNNTNSVILCLFKYLLSNLTCMLNIINAQQNSSYVLNGIAAASFASYPIITNNKGLVTSLLYGLGIPSNGTWNRGDKLPNYSTSAGGYSEYVCVTAGSPGVWKETNQISA